MVLAGVYVSCGIVGLGAGPRSGNWRMVYQDQFVEIETFLPLPRPGGVCFPAIFIPAYVGFNAGNSRGGCMGCIE